MRDSDPRPEKVAVVDEVKEKLSNARATVLTEYRGLSVGEMANLRRNLREAGGEFKIYKNTLVRFAVKELELDLEDLLTGPNAIAFVGDDTVSVAKALRDYARDNDKLIIKGGLLGDKRLSPDDIDALAKLPSRDELLAKLAGGLAAPLQKMAGLLGALPRNMAYGLKALIDQGGAPGAPEAPAAEAEAPAEAAEAAEAPAEAAEAEAPADADTTAEAPEAEAPAEAPAAEAASENAEAEAPADADASAEAPADAETASEESASDADDSEKES